MDTNRFYNIGLWDRRNRKTFYSSPLMLQQDKLECLYITCFWGSLKFVSKY
jgi:hypothetical protein